MGTYTIEADIQHYAIHDLLPYGGYQIELKALSVPVSASAEGLESGSSSIPAESMSHTDYIVGSATTVNLTHSEGIAII